MSNLFSTISLLHLHNLLPDSSTKEEYILLFIRQIKLQYSTLGIALHPKLFVTQDVVPYLHIGVFILSTKFNVYELIL